MSHFQTEGTHICGETRFDVPKLKYSHQLGDALGIQNMAPLSHMTSRRTPKTTICRTGPNRDRSRERPSSGEVRTQDTGTVVQPLKWDNQNQTPSMRNQR